ncbi:hypothetical protein RHECNPAF_890062 [Rhizobium etli CNPAF512]|nr:hypothetical protein RHECNPAF_890062 [Rhizobium etli CNPAF512]
MPLVPEPDCVSDCDPDWVWPLFCVSCWAAAGSAASGDTPSESAAARMARWLLFMFDLRDLDTRCNPHSRAVHACPCCWKGRLEPPIGHLTTWITFRVEGSTITRSSLTIAYAYVGSSGIGVTTTVSGSGCPTTTFSFTTTRSVGAGAFWTKVTTFSGGVAITVVDCAKADADAARMPAAIPIALIFMFSSSLLRVGPLKAEPRKGGSVPGRDFVPGLARPWSLVLLSAGHADIIRAVGSGSTFCPGHFPSLRWSLQSR